MLYFACFILPQRQESIEQNKGSMRNRSLLIVNHIPVFTLSIVSHTVCRLVSGSHSKDLMSAKYYLNGSLSSNEKLAMNMSINEINSDNSE